MYRTIQAEFWTDPKVRGLSRDGKLLFLYFITNPHAHLSGLYYLPIVTILHETGLDRRGFEGASKGLLDSQLVLHDPKFEQWWVVNMFPYQGKGSNTEKGVAAHLVTLHYSSLIEPFLTRYPSIRTHLEGRGFEPPSKGEVDFPSPVPALLTLPSPDLKSTIHAEKKHGKTCIPEGWKLEPDFVEGWRKFGIDPYVEFATFRDHAKAHDRRCHDWPAALRNWMRKAIRLKEDRHG